MKLIRIEKEYGFVEHGGKEYKVDLALIDQPKVGDWLMAHGELAVSRIPSKEALDILKLIQASQVH